jgi:pimeloyl-ACP methyl ester carboxylesterase
MSTIQVQSTQGKTIYLQETHIYYEQYTHHEPETPTILLVHGFLSSTVSFRKLIPLLREKFNVFSIDLPGFGESEKSKKFIYSLRNYGQLIVDFINELHLEKVIIIGHSMGGQIAMQAAVNAPHLISKLILLGCSGYIKRANQFLITCSYLPFFTFGMKFWLSRKDVRQNLLTVVYNQSLVNEELIEAYSKQFQDKNMFYSLVRLLRQREGDFDSVHLRDVKVPALLIWGKHDRVIPLKVGNRLKNDLPNASLKVYDRAGHLLPEEIPEQLFRDICAFSEQENNQSNPGEEKTEPIKSINKSIILT